MAAFEPTLGAFPIDGLGAAATSRRRLPSLAVPALIAGAWAMIVISDATGAAGALHHHALIEGGPPLMVAIPLFLAAWVVMVAAMMLPASLPTIRAVEAATASVVRPVIARASFLASFGLTWAAFGLVAFLGDVVVHRVVDATPWLAARPWLIEAGILAIAGGYQLLPPKRRSLDACRRPDALATASLAGGGAAQLGLRHGLACLGSSWALMLLMFGEGFASLGWMVGLTAVMAYESTGRHGRRVASAVGIVLVLASLAALGVPAAGG